MSRTPSLIRTARPRLLLAAAVVAGLGSRAAAIVGATTPAPETAGVVMVLQSADRQGGFCSGALVAQTVVLTAAHCAPVGANLRIYDPRGSALVAVSAILRHPLYRADAVQRRLRTIDLAMLRFSAPLPSRPKPLALSDSVPSLGQRVRMFGYGLSSETDPRTAGVLRAGVLQARAPASKILLWADDPTGRGGGACFGDSGAPVVGLDAGSLVAIVDWATGAGGKQCGDLTQAALVAPQRPWIDRTIAQWAVRPAPDGGASPSLSP